MTLAAAITRINTWTWTGLGANFVLSEFDGRLAEEDFPALVLGFGSTGGEGFYPATLGGSTTFVVHMTHWLIDSGVGRGQYGIKLDDLVGHFDDYAAEVKDDPTLNDNLREPMHVEMVSAPLVTLAGRNYHGLTFRLRWVVKV